MLLAMIVADGSMERAAFPQRSQKHELHQHPKQVLSTSIPIHFSVSKPISITVPTKIDAIEDIKFNWKNSFSVIFSICIKRGVCFKFIKPSDAATHVVHRERKCPNANAKLAEKSACLGGGDKIGWSSSSDSSGQLSRDSGYSIYISVELVGRR